METVVLRALSLIVVSCIIQLFLDKALHKFKPLHANKAHHFLSSTHPWPLSRMASVVECLASIALPLTVKHDYA